MKNILYLIVFSLFISSCKKKEVVVELPISKYDIKVIELDTIITYPSYSWQAKNYNIDLDIDGKNDVNFTVNHHSFTTDFGTFIGYSNIYFSGISSVDLDYSFAIYNDTLNTNLFEEGELITPNSKWNTAPTIYFFRHEYVSSGLIINKLTNPFIHNYGFIAIRKIVDKDTYYGWAKVSVDPKSSLSIYECAFNRVSNIPIRIGQKE